MDDAYMLHSTVSRKLYQDEKCLRRLTAHLQLSAKLQQPNPHANVDTSIVLSAVNAEDHSPRVAQSCVEEKKTSEATSMDKIAEELASTCLSDVKA
jgi:hypothetical protein